MMRPLRAALFASLTGLVWCASGCKPKNTMAPVDLEMLRPEARDVLQDEQSPRWGELEFARLKNRAHVLILDEPGAVNLHLRLLLGVPPDMDAAARLVAAQGLVVALNQSLALQRVRARLEQRPDRVEIVVQGHAAEAEVIVNGLIELLEGPAPTRTLAKTRGQLLGAMPRPDAAALATAAVVSELLERPILQQLATPAQLKTLSAEALATAWRELLAPERSMLIVHADRTRTPLETPLADLAARWKTPFSFNKMFRGQGNPLDAVRSPADKPRARGSGRAVGDGPRPLVRAPAQETPPTKRAVVAAGRTLSLTTPADRAIARLAQRYLQTQVDVRLVIEGTRAVVLYHLPVSLARPAKSLQAERDRLEKLLQRTPAQWEIDQALSLWLGSRTVAASLHGEDWTALASEAIAVSAEAAEVTRALDVDAMTMAAVTPDALLDFIVEFMRPTRDDPAWTWVIAGADDASYEAIEPPAASE